MRFPRFVLNLRIRSKLLVVCFAVFSVALVIGGELIFARVREAVRQTAEAELGIAADALLLTVRTAAQKSLQSFVRAMPDRDREVAARLYGLSREGELSGDETSVRARHSEEFHAMIDVDGLRRSVLSLQLGERGEAYVMDGKGDLIVHPRLEGNVYGVTDVDGWHFVQEICDRKNGHLSYSWASGNDGGDRQDLVAFRYLPELDWIVVAAVDSEETYRPLRETRRALVIGEAAMLVLALSLSLVAGTLIAGPLRVLTQRLESAAAGNLSPPPSPARGEAEPGLEETADETGDLTRLFRRMVEGLYAITSSARTIAAGDLSRGVDGEGDLADALNQLLTNVRQVVGQIRAATMQMDSAVAQMSAARSEQASSAAQQSASISEVTSTLSELARTSKEVTHSSERVVELATQNQEDARNGVKAAEDALVAMEAIRDAHEGSTRGIVSLSAKVQQINEVMDIIDDIADNTKLIAFNAALEAAGAGESGRRFGVVAQEIRRLADTVVEATEDSRNRVVEIQDATQSMVVASERNSRVFAESSAATQATADSLHKILDSASSTADSARQISMSTQQERTALQQVVDAMREVSAGASLFASKVGETDRAVKALRELAAELSVLIGKYRLEEAPRTSRRGPHEAQA